MNPTARFADFTAGLTFADIPNSTLDRTKSVLLDTLGVAVKGSETDHGKIAIRRAWAGPPGSASVIGGGTADPEAAAFANGVCAHAIDFDDVHGIIHPACSIVPGALAAAEATDASGKAVLTGIVAGYEVTARVSSALNPRLRESGYHPTGVLNGLGVAAAAASIHDASPEVTRNAIAIAADQASGLTAYHESGSMMKHFHGGRPARDGLFAYDLANAGYVGDDDAINGTHGLADVLAEVQPVETYVNALGSTFEIDRTAIKPYPACRHTNGPIAAAISIHDDQDGLHPEDIESITLIIYDLAASLYDKPAPTTHVQALLSLQYTVVTALLAGKLTVDQYDEEFYRDPEWRRLMDEMTFEVSDGYTDAFPNQWPSSVTVSLRDGSEATASVTYPRGSPERPLSRDELEGKFRRLTDHRLDPDAQQRVIDQIDTLETLETNPVDGLLPNE